MKGAFDSHFHIDRLGRELRLATYNLRELQGSTQSMDQSNCVHLCGAVANFCDPITYPSLEDVNFLKSRGIVTTVGLHPRHAAGVRPATIAKLQEMLQWPEVVGLGEIRLDHTAPIEEWAVQRDVLATALGLLESRHVLVLHCRGRHEGEFSELLASLFYQCVGIVPREQKIHLYCFQGLKEDAMDGTFRKCSLWIYQSRRKEEVYHGTY
ncbi:3'-5' ssDNA/RNA exonuclease TatD-like [Mercenaria mercenaria]|uniref:3'-5' ssDNA/RNA exonuclease TatD-like n=1 Tax=Mercenaria mercenaria TaxID=6596 RepID=UPI00234F4E0F|nr:3'-5' ssDNA/RNA exonuclease TatD-like [Mercenaria mercenaria]